MAAIEILLRARELYRQSLKTADADIKSFGASATASTTASAKAMQQLEQAALGAGVRVDTVSKLMARGMSERGAIAVAKAWEAQEKAAAKAGATTKRSLETGQIAAQGLARQLGVVLPEATSRFLGRSQLIGPVLSKAFSAIAIVGLIDVLRQLPETFDAISGAITGWDAKAKKAYDNFLEYNKKAVEATHRLRRVQMEIAGATQAEIIRSDIQRVEAEIKSLKALASETERNAQRTVETVTREQGRRTTTITDESLMRKAKDLQAQAADLQVTLANLRTDLLQATHDIERETANWFEEATANAKEFQETVAKGLIQTRDLMARLDVGRPQILDKLTGRSFFDLLAARPTALVAGGPAFSEEQLNAILARSQQVIDNHREMMAKAADEIGERQIDAHRRTLQLIEESTKASVENIRRAAGHIFDIIFQQGATLGSFIKGIGLTAGRNLFQNLATNVLVGRGGQGGALGLLSRVPGFGRVAGLLGFGGGAVSLGSTVAAGTAGATASLSVPALSIAGAPIAGSALGGGAAAAGGASILGMGLTTAIPVFGAIAAGAFFGLRHLFRRRPEAEFFQDPLANAQRERTLFFFTSMQEAAADLKTAAAHLGNLKPNEPLFKKMTSDAVRERAERDVSYRRDIGGVLANEEI